jgi:glycosyltransferase involved in cell wall biosynthesis
MQNQQTHTPLQETQPLVSFIVACHNLPIPLLCECIDSILALSLAENEREIIIVDDGSETSPINGLTQYGSDIIYVRQHHAGVSVARNRGLQMAHGSYIQIIDGDDYLLKAPYDHCLDLIRNSQQPIDVVIFDFTKTLSSKAKELYQDSSLMSGSEYMRNHSIHGTACGYLFRQAVRSELAFTPGIEYGEDEEFTAQLLVRAEVICVTDAQAYYYRQRKTSAVHQQDDSKKTKRLNDSLEVIVKLHLLEDRLPHHDRLALQRRVAQLTMDYIYNTIMLTHSRKALESCLEELRQQGLFPLPDRDYTQKYKWFRRMSNSTFGRAILLNTLPLMKKER